MEMAMVICCWVLFSFRNNLCAVTLRKTVGGFETLASHCKKADLVLLLLFESHFTEP